MVSRLLPFVFLFVLPAATQAAPAPVAKPDRDRPREAAALPMTSGRHSRGDTLPSAFNAPSSSRCPASIASLLDRAVRGS